MNAVATLVGFLPGALVRARLEREGLPAAGASALCARRLRARYDVDLVGFLNGAGVSELRALAAKLELGAGTAAALRQKLWLWGAARERRALVAAGVSERDIASVQLVPVVAGCRLALGRSSEPTAPLPIARDARFPAAAVLPRVVPPPASLTPPAGEPVHLEELLGRADALVGVRLGDRGRDKGFYGQRIAELLGLPRSSNSAPDWRGEVELKSLAVVRAEGGRWRIKDGPALSMRSVDAAAKLARVLWVVRIDEGEVSGAPVLSWYYQELEGDLADALEASRHLRPKGGAGTTARGWYLRRDFFAACGLLRSLNGD